MSAVGVSAVRTPYAVRCRGDHGIEGLGSCGTVYMTRDEYNFQMSRPDSFWSCPKCGSSGSWDDDNYEKYINESEQEAEYDFSVDLFAQLSSSDLVTLRRSLRNLVNEQDFENEVPEAAQRLLDAVSEAYARRMPDGEDMPPPEHR